MLLFHVLLFSLVTETEREKNTCKVILKPRDLYLYKRLSPYSR